MVRSNLTAEPNNNWDEEKVVLRESIINPAENWVKFAIVS